MADRYVSPVMNKSQNLERGVFSSISSISLYKSVIEERKQLQSNSLVLKSPKPKSPIRNKFAPSPRLINRSKSPDVKSQHKPDEDLGKLNEIIKKLSFQLGKEKKHSEKLEQNLQDTTQNFKTELASALKNAEKLQKSLNLTKSSLVAVTAERDQLLESLKKSEYFALTCQEEFFALTSVVVFEVSRYCSEISQEVKEKLLKQLRSSMGNCKIDLNKAISEVEKWNVISETDLKDELSYSIEYFDQGTDSLASTRGFNNIGIDEFQNAVALYDFEKEREEDLEFARGDVIEILEKNDSGWWIGRLGDKIGTFPFNFVNII